MSRTVYKPSVFGIQLVGEGARGSVYISDGEVVMMDGREMVRTGTAIFDNLSQWCETKGEAQRQVARKLRMAAASLLLEAEERENEGCD